MGVRPNDEVPHWTWFLPSLEVHHEIGDLECVEQPDLDVSSSRARDWGASMLARSLGESGPASADSMVQ